MKRIFALLLSISLGLALTACGSGTVSCPADGGGPVAEVVGKAVNELPESSWSVNDDITISLPQGIYPLGTGSFEITLTNAGSQTMLYGESFSFEYNNNGIWEPLKTIDNYGFHSIGYLLAPGDVKTLTLGTWMLKEPLAEGLYRIIGCDLWVADNAEELRYLGRYTEYLPYELEFYISGEASLSTLGSKDTYQEGTVVTDTAFWLEIQQPEPGAERLEFSFVNDSGGDAEVLLIPTLEKLTVEGQWEAVPFCDQIGFCGTPDPLPQGRRDWSEDLTYLWGGLADGDYRLSFTVADSGGSEYIASGQFTFDDGLCSLPLANTTS